MEMNDLVALAGSPVGTTADFTPYRGVMSPKKMSELLSFHGWKKIYHHPGTWTRVCLWPYLSYTDGKNKSSNYALKNLREHLAGKTAVMNKDVNIFAGMRMHQWMIDKIMPQLGFEFDDGLWRIK